MLIREDNPTFLLLLDIQANTLADIKCSPTIRSMKNYFNFQIFFIVLFKKNNLTFLETSYKICTPHLVRDSKQYNGIFFVYSLPYSNPKV